MSRPGHLGIKDPKTLYSVGASPYSGSVLDPLPGYMYIYKYKYMYMYMRPPPKTTLVGSLRLQAEIRRRSSLMSGFFNAG